MSLAYLLDEHFPRAIAEQVRARRPEIDVLRLTEFRGGELLEQEDDVLLGAAAADGRTLVTYDQATIPPLLTSWASSGRAHAGVVFVDQRTIPQQDVGGLVLALIAHWDARHDWDWADRVGFLERPVRG